ncbi:MAG: alpha/beta hydrolase [Rhodospirillaceae bacterium]|nr:alpha/beta hydrolase [Rhodospirillaceae bacterium]MBL6930459.1 alpha/beta hydrolase [Rhodospirillales bacterium]MBL6942183.1 alpha/beta hydrolase [Rhodospirillales bacterium]
MDIIVDGLKAHVATGGREPVAGEPVVILIHGSGLDRTVWQFQSRNIAFRGIRVLAVDLPGHGRSEGTPPETIAGMADWLNRFMDAADVKQAILIGHSMGSLIALDMAARYPKRVEKMVLMGVAETMPVHPELLEAARQDLPLAPELIIYWGLGEKARVGGHPEPGLWIHGANETLLKLSASGILASDLNACDIYMDAAAMAKKVKCPTQFVLGRNDQMTPLKKGQALADMVKDSHVVIIERSGHMMMAERPNQIYDALKGFVF